MTADAKILSALRAAPWGVSGADIARNLRMTRAGVWGHVEQLRASGYDIEASPRTTDIGWWGRQMLSRRRFIFTPR